MQEAFARLANEETAEPDVEERGMRDSGRKVKLTDTVADFLVRVRVAIRARHQKLDVPASKLKGEIARILKEKG